MELIRILLVGAAIQFNSAYALASSASPHLGVPPSAADVARHDNLIFPSGAGLPSGHGSVVEGQALFVARCVECHGVDGRGGSGGELAGGKQGLKSNDPDKNIGTYWPYATTLFDFIRRAMPLNAPWSLRNAEVYALVAYILNINGVVSAQFTADANSVPKVVMPNRNGFVPIDVKEWVEPR